MKNNLAKLRTGDLFLVLNIFTIYVKVQNIKALLVINYNYQHNSIIKSNISMVLSIYLIT